uniref:Protein translocase subunit SecA 3 n=2 Tax=Lygus hesperus TaxID=30085 RepID=A0A0A9XXR1_LYGHE
MDMRGTTPAKKPRIKDEEEEEIFIYPTANNLDVMTLVYNIDRVKYPSNNWFCTIKDGAPAFLCWGDGYKIAKKVIFDSQTLDPTIMIGESEVKLSEVIRPRSIKEVGSILKLAESVELCLQYNDMVRPYTNCKGYFFRVQTDDPNVKQCLLCRNQKKAPPIECRQIKERITFDEICQAAESLVEERDLWSYTVIGTAVVFIGWLKQYRMDKLYIVTRDINTRIMMGDQFVNIDEIKYIKTLDDIKAALDFLTKCRKCQGIKMIDTKPDTRRAEDCKGFVAGENPFARVTRCKTCLFVRNKVRLRNHRQRMKGQFVRSTADSYPPLKLKSKSLDKTSFEEELAVEDDELCDEGWLVDVLEKVTFPSISWSYVVVDNSIIFQNWDESFVVSKKIVINPDLNVLIYVMDNHVEIEAVQSVENVDDVMRLLNIVDCIQICEGVDDSNSKSEGCTGYYYDPDAKNSDLHAPKRCPKCSREHLLYTRREQRWMKKISMGQADLTPTGEIMLNVKQPSVKVEVEDNPSNSSNR